MNHRAVQAVHLTYQLPQVGVDCIEKVALSRLMPAQKVLDDEDQPDVHSERKDRQRIDFPPESQNVIARDNGS